MTERVTLIDQNMLRFVAREDVTWQSDLGGRVSFRLWKSEQDYLVVTPRCKRLERMGLIRRVTGWTHGRGFVELSPAGKVHIGGDPATPPEPRGGQT